MRFDRRLFVALGASAVAGACAAAGTGAGAGGSASFPSVACAEGVPVTPSAAAVTAQRSLLLGRADEAFAGAQAAATAEPGNPQHQFLLGQAAIAAGNFEAADQAFDRAEQLCSAFGAEIAPERERGWATAFQAGLEAYQAGDTATALASWQRANALFEGRPDAHYNLGVVYSQRGDFPAAINAYRQAITIVDRMPADTSAEEMATRAETRQNAMAGLLSVGARQFAANQFDPAVEVFRHLTTIDPNNRDAWYNLALALYKQERWDDLVPIATRVVQIDPLNENARIILFNAYKGQAEAAQRANNTARQREIQNQALRTLEEVEALPVFVDEIRFEGTEGGQAQLTGRVIGNRATAGQQVRLNFTFFGPNGQVGTQTATVAAPAKGQSTPFQVPLPAGQPVTSFSYTVAR
ncbi:MAG TPA: tetratricopeptide repeat protein [Longimicrobiaceae bacterium]|nr:tetratricopeptide repeat protein [Longimicrobiaceae bacterium]